MKSIQTERKAAGSYAQVAPRIIVTDKVRQFTINRMPLLVAIKTKDEEKYKCKEKYKCTTHGWSMSSEVLVTSSALQHESQQSWKCSCEKALSEVESKRVMICKSTTKAVRKLRNSDR